MPHSWDNTPSGTMRALVLDSPRSSPPGACFTYQTDYPRPSLPNSKYVLVRIHAVGLNRAELRARNAEPVHPVEFGIFKDEFHLDCPKIIGEEFVGEVVEAGKDSGFGIGDRVAAWAYGGGKAYDGSYAEYTICYYRRCWKLPEAAKDVDWEVLGALPMGLWTAYGAIFLAGETKPGDTVFIHGATSSVGMFGLLAAKDKGCTVIASTRQQSKVQKLKDAGADYVVLESDLESPETIRKIAPNGVNTVLELIGLEAVEGISMPALARGGTVVKCGILGKVWKWTVGPGIVPAMRKLTTFTTLDEDYDEAGRVLADAVEKVRRGVYKKENFLDSVFDLQDVGLAHQRMEDCEATGKVVLKIP
jgi:NADPH2:quinone reductase